jgi:hypothetical protein
MLKDTHEFMDRDNRSEFMRHLLGKEQELDRMEQ